MFSWGPVQRLVIRFECDIGSGNVSVEVLLDDMYPRSAVDARCQHALVQAQARLDPGDAASPYQRIPLDLLLRRLAFPVQLDVLVYRLVVSRHLKLKREDDDCA